MNIPSGLMKKGNSAAVDIKEIEMVWNRLRTL